MKKIMNTAESFVYDMCHGMAKAHPELEFVEKYKVVKKKVVDRDKVTLISGGGSGHEPAHAGFVGTGMLDAAVCGDIFASPSQIQVYNALKMTASKKGTLMIVKNYSGDCMNFNNAGALAKEDGIQVDAVYVNDDIAVKDSLYTVGRRGVAGTVFVHKIAGAAAEQGKSLAEVKAVAEKVKEADGLVVGSPVYWASPSGEIISFMDRLAGMAGSALIHKPAAAVASARRAGTTATLDVLNKYFSYHQMPIVSSNYWNVVHGNTPDEVKQDAEGMQIMRVLGRNMAWLLKCIEAGKTAGITAPETEAKVMTNFIR